MLEFIFDLLADFFAWLLRALVGLARFLFRFDFLVELVLELWFGLLELFRRKKAKPGSDRPDQMPD
jgi:hypothetical protein